jgi:hypothetical protein
MDTVAFDTAAIACNPIATHRNGAASLSGQPNLMLLSTADEPGEYNTPSAYASIVRGVHGLKPQP